MKIIITLILVFSFVSVSNAASLALSLQVQMARQSLINKKNAAYQEQVEKQRLIEERKEANRQRLAALRAKNTQTTQSNNSIQIASKVLDNSSSIALLTPTIKPLQISTPVVATPTIVSSTIPSSQTPIANVDISRIRSSWLSWYNTGRVAK